MIETVTDIWSTGHIWHILLVFKGLQEGAPEVHLWCEELFHRPEAGGLRGDYLRGFRHRLTPAGFQVSCRAAPGGLRQMMHTENGLSLILGARFPSHSNAKNHISEENCQQSLPQVPWKKKKTVLKQHEEWIMKGVQGKTTAKSLHSSVALKWHELLCCWILFSSQLWSEWQTDPERKEKRVPFVIDSFN